MHNKLSAVILNNAYFIQHSMVHWHPLFILVFCILVLFIHVLLWNKLDPMATLINHVSM